MNSPRSDRGDITHLESREQSSVAKPSAETRIFAPVGIHESDVQVAGHRVHYRHSGSGPAVVLLHGLLAHSYSWRNVIPTLASRFTAIAPDLLGIGFSDRVRGLDCSMKASAQRLIAFCDALQLGEFDLVGTSHGGALATIMAAELGKRIRRLVLVAPVNPWSRVGRKRIAVLSSPLGRIAFRRTFLRLDALNNWVIQRLFADQAKIPPGMFDAYAAPLRIPGSADYLLEIVRCWGSDLGSLAAYYPSIHAPTLLIWGDRDLAVSPLSAPHVQRAITGSKLVLMPNVGHLPYEEAPAELNRLLMEFLTPVGD